MITSEMVFGFWIMNLICFILGAITVNVSR
jgi:hypothetical protein